MSTSYIPSNARLLHGVRSRLSELAAKSEDQELIWALQAADVALNEVMLREDTQFFVDFYAGLRPLLHTGATLLTSEPNATEIKRLVLGLTPTLSVTMNFSVLTGHITQALKCGEQLVEAIRASSSPELLGLVSQLLNAEKTLHAYRAQQAQRPENCPIAQRTPPSRHKLEQYLKQKFAGRGDIALTNYRPLVGGFQKYTIMFDMEDAQAGHQSCVMRAERNEKFVYLDAGDVINEFDIVKLAHSAGVPVAEPLWLETDASKLGRRFFVSRKVAGENYGSAMAMDTPLTDKVLRSFLNTLAKIHHIPVDAALGGSVLGKWLKHQTMADNTRAGVQSFLDQPWLTKRYPSVAIARIFNWLIDNVPQEDLPPRVIHVDCGPHNILVQDEEVSAVLDWESARIGDPAEDISYFIAIMRQQIDPAKALAWYEEAAGWKISEFRLRYFDVYNLMKTLACCTCAASMYQAESDASIEWCLLALPYSYSVVSQIEEKIALAEAVAGRSR